MRPKAGQDGPVRSGNALALEALARLAALTGDSVLEQRGLSILRGFAGDVALAGSGANPELTLLYDVANHALVLRLRNSGSAACRLNLAANRYSSEPARSLELAAGADLDTVWQLDAGSRWYDFSLSSDHDAHWLRRCAGHLENGLPGLSDPAFGALDAALLGVVAQITGVEAGVEVVGVAQPRHARRQVLGRYRELAGLGRHGRQRVAVQAAALAVGP